MTIYPYQQPVVDALLRVFLVHQASRLHPLRVQPRTHTLIVGPTGTGKSHIARHMAKSLNWALYHINTSGWVVSGARNEPTWPQLLSWISKQPDGQPIVIMLDEIDKGNADDGGWWRSLRAELYALLDGILPTGDHEIACSVDELERRLRSAIVLGCGAFQDIYDRAGKSVGFLPDSHVGSMDHDQLSGCLQRELVNRFGTVIRIPTPTEGDYRAMFDTALSDTQGDVEKTARKIIPTYLPEAMSGKLGARSVEILLYRVFEELSKGDEIHPWVPGFDDYPDV